MAQSSITSFFEKQKQNIDEAAIHAQNQNFNPTKAVKAELLRYHEWQSTHDSNRAETAFEYIILDDDGYVVNSFDDRNFVPYSVDSNLPRTSIVDCNQFVDTTSKHAEPDFMILDENVTLADLEIECNAGEYKMNDY